MENAYGTLVFEKVNFFKTFSRYYIMSGRICHTPERKKKQRVL